MTNPNTLFGDDMKFGLNMAELIANYSIFELSIYEALADMLDDPDFVVTEAILSRVDSVSYKLNVAFDIAKAKADTSAVAKVLVKAEADIREITKLRNELAHGIFGHQDGKLAIISNVFRKGPKPTARFIDRSELVKQATRMVAIMSEIHSSTSMKGISLHGGTVAAIARYEHGGKDVR